MEIRHAGDSEYDLLMEERIRGCISAIYGVGITPDGKRRFVAIILKQPLRDKELYEDADIKSHWDVAYFRIIEMQKYEVDIYRHIWMDFENSVCIYYVYCSIE